MADAFSYDQVPYPSFTFPQTRPDRLSSVGLFYGIDTALPDRCTMLELGCGDGTNLLSFAYCHPESEFVGIDLSSVHIRDANAARDLLGLSNVRFECTDVTAVPPSELGTFDFVIAHGLFSWIPPAVCEHVLQIYHHCLNRNGIGYISYNAFPGFHLREAVRGITRFHTADIESAEDKVRGAKEILGFIREALPSDALNAKLIERELVEMVERTPSNVFHDDLSEFNRAFYFHEFAGMIGDHGLQFVSEADISSSNISGMAEDVVRAIDALGSDIVRREQYIDFIKFRRFRSSLICHSEIELNRSPAPSIVTNFRLASSLKAPEGADLSGTEPLTFRGEKEESVQLNHPLTKTMLAELGGVWTHSIAFNDLLEHASATVGVVEEDVEMAQTYLLQMIKVELVRIFRFSPIAVDAVSEQPRVSDFARWQIERNCPAVTTLTGMNLEPESDLVKMVMLLADGTRSIDEIVNTAADSLAVPDDQRGSFKEQLPILVRNCLNELCSAGLMIG